MFNKFKISYDRGVTLVELLIVIAVISILVSGFVALINPLQKIGQANDARRKSDLSQLANALELYYHDNGKYPTSTLTFTISVAGWGTAWLPYIPKVPIDPSSSNSYAYFSPNTPACSNNQCYYLYANLQTKNDQQLCTSGGKGVCASIAANGIPANACKSTCNYGISSSNTSP